MTTLPAKVSTKERARIRTRYLVSLRGSPLPCRPQTRADCVDVPRPCPWVGCIWNLFLDVSPRTGTVTLNWPDREPGDVPPRCSCALDVADDGGLTLETIRELLGITRERIRQIEAKGLRRLKQNPGAAVALEHLEGLTEEQDRRACR